MNIYQPYHESDACEYRYKNIPALANYIGRLERELDIKAEQLNFRKIVLRSFGKGSRYYRTRVEIEVSREGEIKCPGRGTTPRPRTRPRRSRPRCRRKPRSGRGRSAPLPPERRISAISSAWTAITGFP